MTDFWEDFRNRVLSHTTSADVAYTIYQKVATTGIMGPSIVKPAYYIGHVSVLTMDFVDHVERLLNMKDENRNAVLLRSVMFMRECCRSIIMDINQAAEPMERLVTMLEDILETEDLAAMEDSDLADAAGDDGAGSVEDDDTEDDVERESLAPQRERLEEALRVKLRAGDFSEPVTNELAAAIGAVYLECVQFARELSRLTKAPDEDTATIISILVDLQFGLDTQLRGLLMEDVDTSDTEPTYRLGFFTWSAHLLAELMEKTRAEKKPSSLTR